jgi:SSS family solute:Na+ symporter/sodium/proline symporter
MNLYIIVLGLIVLALLGVSVARLGKVKTKADYLVAGRSLPAFVLVFTLLSSWIGSGSLLAGAENAYKHGFAALWQSAGGWAGLALIYFIAPRARKFAQFTIPDLLEARYNQTARVLGVLAILFAYTAITSYQFIGGGDILHMIFPSVSAKEGQCILAVFVTLFTMIAGMGSVAYMDLVIGLFATITLIVALPIFVHIAGGWSSIEAVLPASHFKVFGDIHPFNHYTTTMADGTKQVVQSALEIFLPTCLLMLGNQSMYQKFFSAKTEKDATRATIGWVIGTVILESVIVALAVVGSALYRTGEVSQRPREVIAYTAIHAFAGSKPFVLFGALLVGAIFAKVVSTANNYLFSPATNLINDVYSRYIRPSASNTEILIVCRLVVVALGGWALWQAIGIKSVLQQSLYAYTIYSAALTPVILAAFFWRRATAAGAVASIAAGTVVTLFWDKPFVSQHLPASVAERDAILPALIASLICLCLVSLLTPRPAEAKLRPFTE